MAVLFNRIINFCKVYNIPISEIAFVIFLVGINIGIYKYSINHIESNSVNAIQEYLDRTQSMDLVIAADNSALPYKNILKDLYYLCGKMRKSYEKLSLNYNTHAATYSVSLFYCAVMLGVFSFLVLKKGWDTTESKYIKITFLYFSATTTLFGILPKVFNNQQNIKENFTKAKAHFSIQLDIYNLIRDTKGFYASK